MPTPFCGSSSHLQDKSQPSHSPTHPICPRLPPSYKSPTHSLTPAASASLCCQNVPDPLPSRANCTGCSPCPQIAPRLLPSPFLGHRHLITESFPARPVENDTHPPDHPLLALYLLRAFIPLACQLQSSFSVCKLHEGKTRPFFGSLLCPQQCNAVSSAEAPAPSRGETGAV